MQFGLFCLVLSPLAFHPGFPDACHIPGPSFSQMLVIPTKDLSGALLTSRNRALGNRATDASSVSGLFFISTVIDAGHTCGQSFRNMTGNAGFALEQHFARLSLGLWNLKCIYLKT